MNMGIDNDVDAIVQNSEFLTGFVNKYFFWLTNMNSKWINSSTQEIDCNKLNSKDANNNYGKTMF